MCMIDTARELSRTKVYRDSLMRARANAAETRETLGMIDAEPNLIRRADLRVMELSNEITRLNDEIFALELQMGITPEGNAGE